MIKTIYTICFLLTIGYVSGQEVIHQTFKDTRIINTHSTETLQKRKLDFRVAHRFGDLAGVAGGWQTFYGLENASDVGIGFDYGLTDNTMIGIHRTKGSSDLRQNVHGLMKIRLMRQEKGGNKPFSLAVLGMGSFSTMPGSSSEGVITNFAKTAHRMSYHVQVFLAKKFGEKISMQVGGAWTYRNLVPSTDQNDLASISGAFKYQMNRSFGIIIDANFPFSSIRNSDAGYYAPIGIGLEWETGGGHIFQLNFTNATGLAETDYLPNTRSNWGDGQYRLGFTIARQFNM